jgi:hypothetical protein
MSDKTLIIQIPCFNEAETLGVTLGALPRAVEGFARVEAQKRWPKRLALVAR